MAQGVEELAQAIATEVSDLIETVNTATAAAAGRITAEDLNQLRDAQAQAEAATAELQGKIDALTAAVAAPGYYGQETGGNDTTGGGTDTTGGTDGGAGDGTVGGEVVDDGTGTNA